VHQAGGPVQQNGSNLQTILAQILSIAIDSNRNLARIRGQEKKQLLLSGGRPLRTTTLRKCEAVARRARI